MTDDSKTDIVILHEIIASHDAAIRAIAERHDAIVNIMAARIDALQRSIVLMGTAADTNFDDLYSAVRAIAKVTVPHLIEVELTSKPNLRTVTKEDDDA